MQLRPVQRRARRVEVRGAEDAAVRAVDGDDVAHDQRHLALVRGARPARAGQQRLRVEQHRVAGDAQQLGEPGVLVLEARVERTHRHAGVARQLGHRQRAQVLRVEQAAAGLEQRLVLEQAARLLGCAHAVRGPGQCAHAWNLNCDSDLTTMLSSPARPVNAPPATSLQQRARTMQSYDVAEWGKPLQMRLRETPHARARRGADQAQLLRGVPFRRAHPRRLLRPGRRQQAQLGRSRHQAAADLGARTDRHGAGGGQRSQRREDRRHLPGQPVDRLRPVLVLQEPTATTCATHMRAMGVGIQGAFATHLLVPHARYLVDAEGLDPATSAVLACSGVTAYSAVQKFGTLARRRLGGRAGLRRRRPDGAVGAGGNGPPARHRLRHRRCQAAGCDSRRVLRPR